jgi:hypothetical protein
MEFSELMRFRNRKANRFNIIGLGYSSSPWRPAKTCVVHPGRVLIRAVDLKTGDYIGGLMCPKCGMRYSENEPTATEEGIEPKHGAQETRIITAKSSKKYYDNFGNLINDPDLIAEAQKGNTIISYSETKEGQDSFYDEGTRRMIRSKKN